MHMVNIFIF